jgi:hypothetical protein
MKKFGLTAAGDGGATRWHSNPRTYGTNTVPLLPTFLHSEILNLKFANPPPRQIRLHYKPLNSRSLLIRQSFGRGGAALPWSKFLALRVGAQPIKMNKRMIVPGSLGLEETQN